MPSSLQIFIGVLMLYVAVVNYLVVHSLRPAVAAEARPTALEATPPAAAPQPTPRCYNEGVYVALLVPAATTTHDNARHTTTLMSTLRLARHPGVAVHVLLVGVEASMLHTHRQWCAGEGLGFACSILKVESGDSRAVFGRVLHDFPCAQDLVVLGARARIDENFFERLNLAPRDRVTCLSVQSGACPAFRVSAAYMRIHPFATDIADGAKREHAYYGAQPVLK
jgi:hypothetical protein